jgi:hypothetical protein
MSNGKMQTLAFRRCLLHFCLTHARTMFQERDKGCGTCQRFAKQAIFVMIRYDIRNILSPERWK